MDAIQDGDDAGSRIEGLRRGGILDLLEGRIYPISSIVFIAFIRARSSAQRT